ncbi:MAG: coproporphyrinogen-III oxidase family protein, partial [Acidobacteriota bacterium]
KAWIFLEANPEDVTPTSLEAWKALGVRTLSLGVQSLQEEALAFLGRRHGPEVARRSVELARGAGFRTVSVDLIYGLPGQDPARWRHDLEQVLALQPDHLSCYQLTVHEGTPFGRRRARRELEELPEEGQAELFLWTHRFLNDAGYSGYEVSSFASLPEHRSRHNLKYWRHTPYLGLGPSAHSYRGRRRWWNARRLASWEERVGIGQRPVEGSEELGRAELALETLMLGLRTYAGVDLEDFRRRFGAPLEEENRELIERLIDQDLLQRTGHRLRPTLAGLGLADSLAVSFQLPEESSSRFGL